MSEHTQSRFRAWETALLCALCLTLLCAVWAQGRTETIDSALVRLHVLAVNDSQAEQEIKLRVRDAVLAYLTPRLEDAESKAETKEILADSLGGIRRAAASAAEGRPVTVTLTRESYPTRTYGALSLPVGEYDSLRVILGEGAGHNWWCVVFPPLCMSLESTEELEEAVGEKTFEILSSDGTTAYRFRLLELWGKIVSSF
ncbi:MAG: stage II sporulation protein R [Oscillospiraceae bacterium]|nr:stage II sporulation protein R [Oscillospiraceae bacterium]